jgi:hypothetical protein
MLPEGKIVSGAVRAALAEDRLGAAGSRECDVDSQNRVNATVHGIAAGKNPAVDGTVAHRDPMHWTAAVSSCFAYTSLPQRSQASARR